MTRFEQFDRAVKARGLRYDVGDGEFRDGDRRLDWEDVIGLIPDMSLDELPSYEDDKADQEMAARTGTGDRQQIPVTE